MVAARTLTDRDYALLLLVRTRLRRFEHWSSERAAELGLTGSQHQLLLAIRGHRDPAGPTIGDLAEYLLIRHNTAVELINRTQQLGVIRRNHDPDDHRVVRLRLTAAGICKLEALAATHIEELSQLTSTIEAMIDDLAGEAPPMSADAD